MMIIKELQITHFTATTTLGFLDSLPSRVIKYVSLQAKYIDYYKF